MNFYKKIPITILVSIFILTGRGVYPEEVQVTEDIIDDVLEEDELPEEAEDILKEDELPEEAEDILKEDELPEEKEDVLEEKIPEAIDEGEIEEIQKEEVFKEEQDSNTPLEYETIVKNIIAKGYDENILEDRNTILRFQAKNNLIVDGIIGEMTEEALIVENKKVIDIVPDEFKDKEWIIVINKTKKILTVYNRGEVYKKYPVALGKSSSPTPDYKFTIINKLVNPYWGGIGGKYTPIKGGDPKNPLGRRWLGLSTDKYWGYGIHGNADPFSIGKYISAGCIRMINEDVEELFEYIPINTEVWIGTKETLENWGIKQYIEYVENKVAYLEQKIN